MECLHSGWPWHDPELCSLLQAGLIGENPLAALPVQQGAHLLGDLPQGLPSAYLRHGFPHTSCFCFASNSCSLCLCFVCMGNNILLTLQCKMFIFVVKMGIEHVLNLYACTLLIAICGAFPGLGLQTDPLNPLKPIPLGRAMAREQESPTAACTFPQTSPPTISLQMRGGVIGADGLTPQGVRDQHISIIYLVSSLLLCSFTTKNNSILFTTREQLILPVSWPLKNNLSLSARCLYSGKLPKMEPFHRVHFWMLTVVLPQVTFFFPPLFFPSHVTLHFPFILLQLFVNFLSGGTCRPHPYRKRPTLGNVSNQHIHQSMQQSYSLGYQDSYSPEYASLHQVTTSFLPF